MNVVWRQPSIWSCAATGFSQRVSSSSSTCRRLSSGISFQLADFLSFCLEARTSFGSRSLTWNFLCDFLPFVLDMSLSGDRTWEITSRAEAKGMWSVPTGSTIFFLLSMFLPVDLSSLDGAAADFLGRLRNGILDGARYTGHVYYRSHLFFFSSSSQRLSPGMYPNTLAASGKAARASQDFFLTGNRPAMSSDEATNSHRIQSSHFSSPYPSFFLRSFPSTRYSPHDPQSLSAHARAMYLCK